MRAIDENILAILKGRKQIGANKPQCAVRIADILYADRIIDPAVETTYYKLGYNNTDESSVSNFVRASDGRYMCAWINSSLQLVVGFTPGKEFLEQDYAPTEIVTYPGITVGVRGPGCVSLYKRANGSVLIFINDLAEGAANLKCYISTNGKGDDVVYYSTVYTSTATGAGSFFGYMVSKPITIASGRMVISFCQVKKNTWNMGCACIAVSDDEGATWTVTYNYGALVNQPDMVSSVVQIPDGTLYRIMAMFGNWSYLQKSTDNGDNWTSIGIANSDYNSEIFYDDFVDTLYRYKADVDTLYQISDPNQTNVEAWTWETVTTLNVSNSNVETEKMNKRMYTITDGTLVVQNNNNDGVQRIVGIGPAESPLHPKSISINKSKGQSSSATVEIDNKDGALSFGNTQNINALLLKPNTGIFIDQGYGENTIRTFTGIIDTIDFKSFPSSITVQARDNLKKALDQTITRYDKHVFTYPNCTIESIVLELCVLCGLTTQNVEATGITLEEFTFNYESYADAFQRLADLASFEWGCDEDGNFYFRRDYQGNNTDIAYTFTEGEDLTDIAITLDDNDLYHRVDVYGKDGDTVLLAQAYFPNPTQYNISTQRIMKIDAPEANTLAACQEIANRAVYTMQGRVRKISFGAIAVPWLQCGDYIQIVEHNTYIDGIYRVASLDYSQTDKGFKMSVTANYYGGAFIYPADAATATQTADPDANLIPQMTANDAPSGVAKASSIYQSIYQPWQAFNDTSEDYYWNAITNKGWISYEFEEKTIIDKYTLKARQLESYNTAMPKDWILEALAADGTWVTLDTRTNQTAWGASEERTFLFTNTTPYIRYCLTVSANNGYARLQLEQLKMFYGGGS